MTLGQASLGHFSLVGVCIIHVDDIGLAGEGPLFESFVRQLKERFTFRKWRRRSGTFVGAWVQQNEDFSISLSQYVFWSARVHAHGSGGLSCSR